MSIETPESLAAHKGFELGEKFGRAHCGHAQELAELRSQLEALRDEVERLGKCNTCDGTGIMDVVVRVEPPDAYEITEPTLCGECLGTGKNHHAALAAEVERLTAERDQRDRDAHENALEIRKLTDRNCALEKELSEASTHVCALPDSIAESMNMGDGSYHP